MMRKTYKSKKEATTVLDAKHFRNDDKTSTFDAYYINNIKKSKRELSCLGLTEQSHVPGYKSKRKKYVKRIIKDVDKSFSDSELKATCLTPDKSIRVNRGPDLFDQLLNTTTSPKLTFSKIQSNKNDDKTSTFDAYYINNIKKSKRELSCLGLTEQSHVPGYKSKRKKYVKCIIKDVDKSFSDSELKATCLTPDKSIRVNRGPDLFDQLLNTTTSSKLTFSKIQSNNFSDSELKATCLTPDKSIRVNRGPDLFDQLLNTTTSSKLTFSKIQSNKKLKLTPLKSAKCYTRSKKKINYSSETDDDSDCKVSENSSTSVNHDVIDLRNYDLIIVKENIKHNADDDSINAIANCSSFIKKFSTNRKNTNEYYKKINKHHRLTENLLPYNINSPLTSTPLSKKYCHKSIYNFSPIPVDDFEADDNRTRLKENDVLPEFRTENISDAKCSTSDNNLKNLPDISITKKTRHILSIEKSMEEIKCEHNLLETSKSNSSHHETVERSPIVSGKQSMKYDLKYKLHESNKYLLMKPDQEKCNSSLSDSSNSKSPICSMLCSKPFLGFSNVGGDHRTSVILNSSEDLFNSVIEDASENKNIDVGENYNNKCSTLSLPTTLSQESFYDANSNFTFNNTSAHIVDQRDTSNDRKSSSLKTHDIYKENNNGNSKNDDDINVKHLDTLHDREKSNNSICLKEDLDKTDNIICSDSFYRDSANKSYNSSYVENMKSENIETSVLDISDDSYESDTDQKNFASFVTIRKRNEDRTYDTSIFILNSSDPNSSIDDSNNTVLCNKETIGSPDKEPRSQETSSDFNVSAMCTYLPNNNLVDQHGEIVKNSTVNISRKNSSCISEIVTTSLESDHRPSIVLQPGKKWERSLSIYRRMTFMGENLEASLLEESLTTKGRKYRQSVIDTIESQNQTGSIYNDSHTHPRSSIVPKSRKPTVKIIKEQNSSRLSLCSTIYYDDLTGFISEECDDTLVELSKLSIADVEHDITVIEKHNASERLATARDYVLRRCNQTEAILFDECYPDTVLKNCRKIGEGVYGEVFLWRARDGRARVLKVVPIAGSTRVNGEQQKDFHEIISEIVIAMELSALRSPIADIESHFDEGKDIDTLDLHLIENATDTFNEVLAVKCVNGSYPSRLLDLWELYDECKGSENDNPAILPIDQQYIVLELANAGQDLESYEFNNAEQAYTLFIQVAFGLAVGEEAFQFEHRDLHWGNVLISPTEQKFATYVLRGTVHRVPRGGVAATVIDYSLSRVTLPRGAGAGAGGAGGAALYNDLAADDGLFDAVGDYQFQVYRLMRERLGNDWKNFEAYTNILWLHYTLDKMITALRYKRTNTKIHKQYINKLKAIRNRILNYDSAVQFVLTDNEY